MKTIKASEIRVGDMLDLEDSPYVDSEDTHWEYQYGLVCGVEREATDRLRIDFEDVGSVYLPPHGEVAWVEHNAKYAQEIATAVMMEIDLHIGA